MKMGIQFSGGKDGLAVLHLLKDELKHATVYFGDSGMAYPHMREFVRRTCGDLGANLKIVTPPVRIEDYHAAYGLPSDIVPVESSYQMQRFLKDKRQTLLQSSLSCCSAMLWLPLYGAMLDDGVDVVVRGSKACDGHVGAPDGTVDPNGITFKSPLWDWSDDDVFAYLNAIGAVLPAHYAEVNNSFDCLYCTAFLNHPGAGQRLEWTRKHYPAEWPELAGRLAKLRGILQSDFAAIDAALVPGGTAPPPSCEAS